MRKELNINSDLTPLTSTQMNLIRGGDNNDVSPSGATEDGLPTLPTLPADMTPTPDYVADNNNGKHKGQDKRS